MCVLKSIIMAVAWFKKKMSTRPTKWHSWFACNTNFSFLKNLNGSGESIRVTRCVYGYEPWAICQPKQMRCKWCRPICTLCNSPPLKMQLLKNYCLCDMCEICFAHMTFFKTKKELSFDTNHQHVDQKHFWPYFFWAKCTSIMIINLYLK